MAILQSTTVTGSLIISGSQENLVQIIGSGSTLFAVNGASGQLFGVSDDLTDSLFSVNTIAGLPVIEAFADNTVKIGTYGSEELIVSSSQVYITSASLSGPTLFLDGNVGILNTAPGEALTVGDGTADTSVAIKKSDNNVSDHLQFFNGTTRVGEIGTQDDTWLRINQVTSKNIYTPRYIRADGGFFVDSTSYGINGSGRLLSNSLSGTYSNNLTFSGNITVGGNLIVNNNVGIGESTPDFALQVATPEETTDPISFAFDITRENSGTRGMTFGMATNDTFGAIGTHNADLQLGHTFGTESNGQPAFYPTLTIQHIDQSVGKVGIGTITPSSTLHVNGPDTNNHTPTVYLKNNGGNGGEGDVLDVETARGDGASDSYIARFRNSVSTKLYIQGDGNVGIGTTSPSEKLHVQGNITSSGNLTLEGNAGYPIFESGFGGSGWRVDSSANAEFQNLTVRGTFSVYELLAQQIRATNGSLLVATSGKVDSVDGTTLFFDSGSGYGHGFVAGDVLISQRLDPVGGQLERTFITVQSVANTGSLVYTDASGSPSTPQPGQEFVRIGHTSNANRQGHIYLTADDTYAPYIGVRDGLSGSAQFEGGESIEKVRVGRLDGITSSTFGSLSGYGFWAKGDAYLEGGISATFGDIGGFGISQTTISSSNDNLILRSNGQITASAADISGKITAGSGQIADWTITSDAIYKTVGSVYNIIGRPDDIPGAWGTTWENGFTVGKDSNNRMWFSGDESGNHYEMAIYSASTYIVRLGTNENKIAGWTIDNDSIFSGTRDISGYSTSGITLYSGGSIHTPNFYVDTSGNAFFKGTLSAPAGNIGGFAITDSAITGSGFYLSGSATGNEFFISSSNFNVKANGDVTGSSVLFDGGKIGGFDITSDKLSITSGDFEILQGSLFSNNIGYRVVETTGGSRQINMRYDTADDSLEFLIYKDSNNYFNVGDAYANQYTGWGLNLHVAGEDILKVENDIVTLSGFTATKDAFAGDNFYISGSATGNEFFISSSNFNVKANGDVTGSSVLFTGGRIGDEYQNITFDPTGNITLNNVELKISDTTGLRSDIYDGANSKRVVLKDNTIAYTTFEDDTLITIIGTDGAIKSTISVETKYTEGTISATDIAVGDIIDSDKPVSLVNTGGGHAVLPFSFLSKTFLLYVNRYQPRTIRVFSPFGDATVSASFDSTNNGTFNDGVAATIAPQNTATDINASDIISGTWPTSGDDYFKIESDFPILAFNDGPDGDYVSLYPLSKEILHADEGVGINLNGNTSITHQGGGYYTGNTPFQVQRIGDGGGGDSDQGMPLQGLGDTYIIPHSVGGYEIVSVEPNTVKAYTLTAGTKTLSNTVDHSAASKTNPLNTTVGSDNSGGSGIHTGAMLFEGTAPFALRTQDPQDDEYHVIGYRRTQRQAYDNSTSIKGDRIRTGKIQSNNWNDSTVGSLIDLNLGTAHLGGSGSNASFYFDGTDLFLTGSVNATDGTFTGTISAGDGDIAGFTISSDQITASSGILNLKANGRITGSAVSFTGGRLAGFDFTSTAFQSRQFDSNQNRAFQIYTGFGTTEAFISGAGDTSIGASSIDAFGFFNDPYNYWQRVSQDFELNDQQYFRVGDSTEWIFWNDTAFDVNLDGATLGTLTLDNLSDQGTELTALTINGSNVVGFSELGTNAFTSTTIGTTTNPLTVSTGLNLNSGTTFDGSVAKTISVDVSDFMTNGDNDRIVTATGTDGMNAETNLTFNSSNELYLNGQQGIGIASPRDDLHIKFDSVTSIPNATAGSADAWNNTDKAHVFLEAGNNAMVFGVNGTTNTRQAWIQVGHDTPANANSTGELLLNPLHSNVGINTTAPSEALEVEGNIKLSGNVVLDAGSGIDFSATGQTGGMSSELLDDYEEGTFTPVYRHTGGTPTSESYDDQTYGKYTRIGNVVHCAGRIRTNGLTWSSTTLNTVLGGFPYSCVSPLTSGTGCVAGTIGFASGFSSTKPVTFQLRDDQTNALLYGESITSNEVQGQPNIQSGDFTTGASADKNTIVFQITYQVE